MCIQKISDATKHRRQQKFKLQILTKHNAARYFLFCIFFVPTTTVSPLRVQPCATKGEYVLCCNITKYYLLFVQVYVSFAFSLTILEFAKEQKIKINKSQTKQIPTTKNIPFSSVLFSLFFFVTSQTKYCATIQNYIYIKVFLVKKHAAKKKRNNKTAKN